MRVVRRVAWFAAVALALSASGCALLMFGAGAAAGVGTVAYLKGELRASKEAPLAKVAKATELALKDMQFPITGRQDSASRVRLIVRASGDRRIEINLVKVSGTVTEIRIRVAVFGDEALSRLILEKIEKRL